MEMSKYVLSFVLSGKEADEGVVAEQGGVRLWWVGQYTRCVGEVEAGRGERAEVGDQAI